MRSTEEMMRTIDLEGFYKIQSDNRDLNYEKYFSDGRDINIDSLDEYNSHNTKQLSYDELKEVLLSNNYVKKELNIL